MKVSEIFGKKIIGSTGRQGYVVSVGEIGGSIVLKCADINELEFSVKLENVSSFGENIIYDGEETAEKEFYALRLGRACFDLKGKYLGKLNDFTISRGKLKTAKIGRKNYPAEGLIFGDAVLVRDLRRLKADVVKGGETVFRKGAPVTKELLGEAASIGEYVQTTLKSI